MRRRRRRRRRSQTGPFEKIRKSTLPLSET
jgi:hypothetical protein